MGLTKEEIKKIFENFSPEPLKPNSDLYIDLFSARGVNPIKSYEIKLKLDPIGSNHFLLPGYRGCGKSTELNGLAFRLETEEKFLIVRLNLFKDLDLYNSEYIEILLYTIERLIKCSDDHQIQVAKELNDLLKEWGKSTEIEKIKKIIGEVETSTEASIGTSIAWFGEFLAKIRATVMASASYKKTVKEIIEHKLADLIDLANRIITNIKLSMANSETNGLLFIMEDLDKLLPEKAEDLFFKHNAILRSLKANFIYTFPVNLLYDSRFIDVKNNFTDCIELPMVKVKTKDGEKFEIGRELLKEVVLKRIDLKYFETEELIYDFIDLCGGVLRDLFKLVNTAFDNVVIEEREQITNADFNSAFYRLKRDYENTIAERRVDGKVIFTAEELYANLVDLHNSTTKKIDHNQVTLSLIQNLCILGYNETWWYDLHPVVVHILRERELI